MDRPTNTRNTRFEPAYNLENERVYDIVVGGEPYKASLLIIKFKSGDRYYFRTDKLVPELEDMRDPEMRDFTYTLGNEAYAARFITEYAKKTAVNLPENEVEVFGRRQGRKQPMKRLVPTLPEGVEAIEEPVVNEDGIRYRIPFGGRRRSRRKSQRRRKNKRTRRH
jgi:hypothetical protein